MKRLSLRDARLRRNLTQDELAARAGVDQTTISSLETGRHTNPTLETVQRLADALGVSPARLTFADTDVKARAS